MGNVYVPFHQLPSEGLSERFSYAQGTYHAQPTIVGLAQACSGSLRLVQACPN